MQESDQTTPTWHVWPKGWPHDDGPHVVRARTRGQAAAISQRAAHEAGYRLRFTDMRAVRAQEAADA